METSRKKIVQRLKRDGWYLDRSGGNHDIFANSKKPETMIVVPRHKTVSPGVARKIAKEAGW